MLEYARISDAENQRKRMEAAHPKPMLVNCCMWRYRLQVAASYRGMMRLADIPVHGVVTSLAGVFVGIVTLTRLATLCFLHLHWQHSTLDAPVVDPWAAEPHLSQCSRRAHSSALRSPTATCLHRKAHDWGALATARLIWPGSSTSKANAG
jgi:hypothetical protein